MYSFGYFPGVWLFYADVSEHSICSIFIGWIWSTRWHKKTGTSEIRSGSHVQLAALQNRDLELQTTSLKRQVVMVQFLSINVCFWISSIFVGFFKSSSFFVSLCILLIQPMKMEQIECSETSANHNQTPGKYPKEYIQDSKHGGSLKSRVLQHVSDHTGSIIREPCIVLG